MVDDDVVVVDDDPDSVVFKLFVLYSHIIHINKMLSSDYIYLIGRGI